MKKTFIYALTFVCTGFAGAAFAQTGTPVAPHTTTVRQQAEGTTAPRAASDRSGQTSAASSSSASTTRNNTRPAKIKKVSDRPRGGNIDPTKRAEQAKIAPVKIGN